MRTASTHIQVHLHTHAHNIHTTHAHIRIHAHAHTHAHTHAYTYARSRAITKGLLTLAESRDADTQGLVGHLQRVLVAPEGLVPATRRVSKLSLNSQVDMLRTVTESTVENNAQSGRIVWTEAQDRQALVENIIGLSE